jgi:hypothetical protein
MAAYMISPAGETEWRMNADEFAARLRNRWPDARVEPGAAATIMVRFELDDADGYLADDGITLWVERGELEQAAELAVWFREQVPADLPLEFADEGFESEAAVEPGITPPELAQAYEAGGA